MTNTKLRKRALLSSVAMLLVALVALGSATFAWFTANPNAKASGLAMHSSASTGLVIDTQYDGNTNYTHSEILNKQSSDTTADELGTSSAGTSTYPASVPLNPASLTSAGTLKTTDAAGSGNYVGVVGGAVSAATAGYYQETIDCKTTDGSEKALTSIKVTLKNPGSPTIKGAVRVAILDGSSTLGIWALGADATPTRLKDTDTTYPDTRESYTVTASGTAITTGLPTIPANGNKTLTVIVYLDGEDDKCYSDNALTADCFGSIDIDLSIAE